MSKSAARARHPLTGELEAEPAHRIGIHCNACGEQMAEYVAANNPYVTIVRGDGTGTLFHWRCVRVVDREPDSTGLHPYYELSKVSETHAPSAR